ncbi:MAG: hypothetical protein R3Y62_02865, partial [Eubacteriales bacterium]
RQVLDYKTRAYHFFRSIKKCQPEWVGVFYGAGDEALLNVTTCHWQVVLILISSLVTTRYK